MASLIVRVVLKVTIGIRVTEEEYDGLDLTDCDLEAYPEFTGLRGAGKYSYSI
jgi:ammonium transporter, Amt family